MYLPVEMTEVRLAATSTCAPDLAAQRLIASTQPEEEWRADEMGERWVCRSVFMHTD